MAKEQNSKGKIWQIPLASLIVVLVGVGSAAITKRAMNSHQTEDTIKDVVKLEKDTTEAIGELKKEGCLPARENEKGQIRLEGKVDAMAGKVDSLDKTVTLLKDDIAASRTEQRDAKAEILKAIKGEP